MPVVFLGYRHELITQPQIQGERRSDLPVVLEISAELFLAPIEHLNGLVNLSTPERESGWQIGFHLVHIASQEGVERVERIEPVVAAVDLVHYQAHRIVLRSDLESVIGSRDRQAIPIGVEILEEQCAVPGKAHISDTVPIGELSHALPIRYEQQVDAVEILPIRLVVRKRLRGLAAVKSERKLVQGRRAENAGV